MRETEWRDINEKPAAPVAVLLYFANLTFKNYDDEAPVEFPPYREERIEVGFWDGECWCFAGTGHDAFEFKGTEGYPDEVFPTHWTQLPQPPKP